MFAGLPVYVSLFGFSKTGSLGSTKRASHTLFLAHKIVKNKKRLPLILQQNLLFVSHCIDTNY